MPVTEEVRVGHTATVHTESGHAAVGVHGEPHVGESVGGVDGERVAGVALGRGFLDDGDPLRVGDEFLGRHHALHRGGLHRDEGRIVALEPRRVDHDAVDHTGSAEPHDGLIDPRPPAPPRLPAVIDLTLVPESGRLVLGGRGLDEVLTLGEQLVAGPDNRAAEISKCQVGHGGEVWSGTGGDGWRLRSHGF